jgi:hypothetical protein
MPPLRKWLLVGGALVFIAIASIIISVERYHRVGPPAQERRTREAVIQPLLRTNASRDEVINALGLEFQDFSVGSSNRNALERAFHHARVRQAAEKYPGVLFNTTSLTMTWLSFDSEGKLQDFYLCEQ